MPSTASLVKEFLGQLMGELNDSRRLYAALLGIKNGSKYPEAYDELLESTEQWGTKIKHEIREVTNGTFTF